MTRFLSNSSLIWLLVAAQAIAALIGPACLEICREADGTSHLEWVTHACCGDEAIESLDIERGVEAGTDACLGLACDDDPFGHHLVPADWGSRARVFVLRATLPAGTSIALAQWKQDGPARWFGETWPAAPPGESRRSLRSTILII